MSTPLMSLNPTQRERFTEVLRVLNEVQEQGALFNMKNWRTENSCGTTACAIGWCAMDPWFVERGFYFDAENNYPVYESPDGTLYSNWHSVFTFFGNDTRFSIHTSDLCEFLFNRIKYDEDDATIEAVIGRVGTLLEYQDECGVQGGE